MGIPGININDVTSAMTQMTFQNIRNLGANGNQPLITNQNDFQIFDNVTWIKGKHTFKLGGSVTFRSREILNADTIVGQFDFNNNMTSNCAGTVGRLHPQRSTGFDVASFLLGYATTKTRNLFDAGTYTEKRPEYALYVQDDFRVNSKLTLNLGLRCEVYVPWVEIEDRQSNFDVTTGQFVVASDNATPGRRPGRPLPADLLEGGRRPALRLRLRRLRHRPHHRPRRRRGVLELHARRDVLVEGPEPAVPAVDGADGVAEHQLLTEPQESSPTACRRPRAWTSRPARRRHHALDLRPRLPRRLHDQLEPQRPAAALHELHGRARLRGRARPPVPRQGRPERGPGDGRRHELQREPAVRHPGAGAAHVGQVQSTGILDYQALLAKLQRRFANGFSLLAAYTLAKAQDYNSDNDGTVTVANVYNIAGYNYAAVRLQHQAHAERGRNVRAARSRARSGTAAGSSSGIGYYRTGYPFTPGQTQGILSTTPGGTGQRPNVVGDWELDNPTIDKWFEPAAFQPPADTTGTYGDAGRNIMRGPSQFNIDMSLIKYTRFGRFNVELRCEAFNILNHPQFQPEPDDRERGGGADIGHAAKPGVRPLRHDGAQHPVRGQADVLIG